MRVSSWLLITFLHLLRIWERKKQNDTAPEKKKSNTRWKGYRKWESVVVCMDRWELFIRFKLVTSWTPFPMPFKSPSSLKSELNYEWYTRMDTIRTSSSARVRWCSQWSFNASVYIFIIVLVIQRRILSCNPSSSFLSKIQKTSDIFRFDGIVWSPLFTWWTCAWIIS